MQEPQHVAVDLATTSATQLGVVIGGYLNVPTHIYDPTGVTPPASIARRALCIDGSITEYHGSYTISRSFVFTTIANGRFDLLPISCTAAGELPEECMYTPQDIVAANVTTAANPPRPTTNVPLGYYSLGSRTSCSTMDSFDESGFPLRLRATDGVCQNYTTIAEVYDPIAYTDWVKFRAEDDPHFSIWGG